MATQIHLSREMRLVDITMIGVGAMIGAGIFVLTGMAAGMAGPALILVFLLNGVVALLTAMTYAELGSCFHHAGGGYLWVKTALPDPNGFLSGWISWFAQAVACSLYSLGFGAYLGVVLRAAGLPELQTGFMTQEKWLAILACSFFAYINFRGAAETGKAGNVVTVGKVVVIGMFVAVGIWAMAQRPGWTSSFEPFMTHGWVGVFAAMGLTFIAFEGYEIIAQTSEEVENPKRNVPRAVFLALLIVVPIYLLVAWVAIGAVEPPPGLSVSDYLGRERETALVAAASQFVRGGGVVILLGGLLSTLSALNATIYSSSRMAFAMARDANLPQMLGRVHPVRATPHLAILCSTIIILGMAILLPIEDVAAAANIMFVLLFVQVNIAAIRLRKMRPELDRGFRIPLMPLPPLLAIGVMLFLAYFLITTYPKALIAAAGWIAAGAVVYYGYSRKREAAFVEREEWMERIERKEYRVLVALAEPRNLETLMEVAIAVAKHHNGEIVALGVAEVPEGEVLMTGRRPARELAPLLERAVEYAAERGVPANPVVKIARRVSHGIVETAREGECNFLVLGRPRPRSFIERMLASIVERVVDSAPCQVGVVYGSIQHDGIRGIAVPVTRGDHSQLAAELAPAFANCFDAPVRALTLIESGSNQQESDRQIAEARQTLQAAGLQVDLEVLRRRDVARGLSQAMSRGDLVLIGAATAASVASVLVETVPALLARMGRNPVVVVREVEHRRAHRFERVFFGRH